MKTHLLALILAVSAGCCGLTPESLPEAPPGDSLPPAQDDVIPTGLSSFYLYMYDSEDPVDFGGSTVYYFEVVNQGPRSDAEISFMLPEGTSFSSASGGHVVEGNEVSWNAQLSTDEAFEGWVGVEVGKTGTLEAILTVGTGDRIQSITEDTTVYG
ncbi:MAG: hypothetical protein AB1295_04205 [Candidatus Micrarchaeota archaeon]